MLPALIRLIAAALTAANLLIPSSDTAVHMLRNGEVLRFHVVAQDDTDEMQRVKLCVRDAVQNCYAAHAPKGSMLARAEALLPLMEKAAEDAAADEGFGGEVHITLGNTWFDARTLGTLAIPEGEYPALVVRLGDGQGRNWWGLLDPELSARWAAIPQEEAINGQVQWDWSWQGLLAALRQCFAGIRGGA